MTALEPGDDFYVVEAFKDGKRHRRYGNPNPKGYPKLQHAKSAANLWIRERGADRVEIRKYKLEGGELAAVATGDVDPQYTWRTKVVWG